MKAIRERAEVAADAAWGAGRLTLRYFQSGVEVERKADASPVTIADREAEAYLAEVLGARYPDDAFEGEESGARAGTSGYTWIIDPIDGTKSFIHGVPLYGVMVGLEGPDGDVVAGAISIPPLGDLHVAWRGGGAWWNGRRARVSEVDRIEEACVLYTGDECFELTGTTAARDRVAGAARLVRGWGDCYGHLLVATGRAEVMLDPVLADWDCAALQPIVEEAGGVFTDWSGSVTARGKSGVSTNALLAEDVRRRISE